MGVTTLILEISCVVDHAKLPNVVIVAVVGFIYFWRQMKAFRPLEGRCYDKIQFEWIHLVNYYTRKPSFTLKSSKILFCEHRMATMVEVFDGAVGKKKKTLFC